MNKFYLIKTCLTLIIISGALFSKSQTIISGGNPARFGIDADVISDSFAFGTLMPSPLASDDWFKKIGGTGLAVIDTTGAAKARSILQAGKDYIFNLPSYYPRFSIQNNNLFLDARYARDGAMQDSTFFAGNAQNAQDPTTWGGSTTVGTVLDKCDIVDTYIHLRRDGPVLTGPNQNHLILILAASLVATNGSHYMDFELFKQRIYYNQSLGKFFNSGPIGSGGHTLWEFNPDGSVAEMGDMQISFTYNNTNVTSTNIYVWVTQTVYNTVQPQRFAFVPNSFNTGTVPGYGYAEITALQPNGTLPVWGIVNSGNVPAPVWGTTSKDIGSSSNNYFSTHYAAGQFAEVAIDFTALGTDPAFNPYNNPCQPPFTRFIAKTRSSGSFNAALKDFTGPYPFLEDFTPLPDITPPAHLSCNIQTLNLSPVTVQTPGVYEWSTSDGNIISKTDTPYVQISKAGTYVLKTRTYLGCSSRSDSVIIQGDDNKPIAKAGGPYYISNANPITQLKGGDAAASNYSTPFGNSQGLIWKWTGPNNFEKYTEYCDAAGIGNYTLTVTELRNGCTATASTLVDFLSALPIKLTKLTGTQINKNTVDISWTVTSEEGTESYILERSTDGIHFSAVYKIASTGISSKGNYEYTDNVTGSANVIYYRVKIYARSTLYSLSDIVTVKIKTDFTHSFISSVVQNGLRTNPIIKFYAATNGTAGLKIFDSHGLMTVVKNIMMTAGLNSIEIPAARLNSAGIKFVQINMQQEKLNYKFLFR
ncbi:MAG TPA: hypothetical protein VMY77_07280 [Chitinophagaceae bacterium]|nr:hypothetical protein [Chitinophagaceae bacterium]